MDFQEEEEHYCCNEIMKNEVDYYNCHICGKSITNNDYLIDQWSDTHNFNFKENKNKKQKNYAVR